MIAYAWHFLLMSRCYQGFLDSECLNASYENENNYQVEDIRKKKALAEQEYRNSMPASSYQQQKLRVCEVCSAYLGIHDNDRRLADHFGGKLHLGFIKVGHFDIQCGPYVRPDNWVELSDGDHSNMTRGYTLYLLAEISINFLFHPSRFERSFRSFSPILRIGG